MINDNDLNVLWEDASTITIASAAARVSNVLPLLPNGKNPKRILLTISGSASLSVRLSVGEDTGMLVTNGIAVSRNQLPIVLPALGFTWINTFGDATGSTLHVTAMND